MLENIGAKVDGIVSDGAATNRKVWKELGVSGLKNNVVNSFTHPMDTTRKIYLFSDALHLIKTVRNRLFNVKFLKVGSYLIFNFYHYKYYQIFLSLYRLPLKKNVSVGGIMLKFSTMMQIIFSAYVQKSQIDIYIWIQWPK